MTNESPATSENSRAIEMTRRFRDHLICNGDQYSKPGVIVGESTYLELSPEERDDILAAWINATPDATVEDYDLIGERISSYEFADLDKVDLDLIGRVNYDGPTDEFDERRDYGYTNVLGWDYAETPDHVEADNPTRAVADLVDTLNDAPLYRAETTRADWRSRDWVRTSIPLGEQSPTLSDQVTDGQYTRHYSELKAELLAGTYDAQEHGSVWLEISRATWGDYCGDTVERSNYEVLTEEYPNTFYEVTGGYGSHTLMLRVDGARITEELFDRLVALDEYPLLDDEHHSTLEWKLAEESWKDFGRDDFKSELNKDLASALEIDIDDVEQWDGYPSDDAIDAWFWDHKREYPKDPEAPSGNPIWDSENAYLCEEATSAYFPRLDEAAVLYAAYLERNWGGIEP